MGSKMYQDNAFTIETAPENVDDLTNLYSYKGFLQATLASLSRGYLQHRAVKSKWAIVYLSLEHFDYYNVSCGVEKGDELLRKVAKKISEVFYNSPKGHVSTTSFAAYGPVSDIENRVKTIHDWLDEGLRDTKFHDILWLRAGWRQIEGVDSVDDMAAAYSDAKAACQTLRGLRDRYVVEADDCIIETGRRERNVLRLFDDALASGAIKAYYQPIVNTNTAQICDVEVLSRWLTEDGSAVAFYPDQYIPVLERAGRIVEHDMRVLELACCNARARLDAGEACPAFSVNLSRRDFECADLVERVISVVDEHDVPHGMVSVEVTESALVESGEALKRAVEAFHKHGIQVWLDDFGSGYSSLNVLKDFDFDVVKVDRGFLWGAFVKGKRGTEVYRRAEILLSTIVALTKTLGIKSLVEGIDEEGQFARLHEFGYDMLQGFYFGRPAPHMGEVDQGNPGDHYAGDMSIVDASTRRPC